VKWLPKNHHWSKVAMVKLYASECDYN